MSSEKKNDKTEKIVKSTIIIGNFNTNLSTTWIKFKYLTAVRRKNVCLHDHEIGKVFTDKTQKIITEKIDKMGLRV